MCPPTEYRDQARVRRPTPERGPPTLGRGQRGERRVFSAVPGRRAVWHRSGRARSSPPTQHRSPLPTARGALARGSGAPDQYRPTLKLSRATDAAFEYGLKCELYLRGGAMAVLDWFGGAAIVVQRYTILVKRLICRLVTNDSVSVVRRGEAQLQR